jgi:hypothetical protein
MSGHRSCGCGCGTDIYPGSYAHQIGSRFYAQKCVRLTVVPSAPTPEPVHLATRPAETISVPA